MVIGGGCEAQGAGAPADAEWNLSFNLSELQCFSGGSISEILFPFSRKPQAQCTILDLTIAQFSGQKCSGRCSKTCWNTCPC